MSGPALPFENEKAPLFSSASTPATAAKLLDLGFLEFHVLAHDRIIFLENELVGLGAGILLGDIEESGVGG
jgi:hypothetical protein